MALANASLIGDIDLGGIGNRGIEGGDFAAIFAAQAQVQETQAAREREERRQRNKVFLISGSVVSSVIILILLFYYTTSKTK
jgi:hypothetical protein